MLTYRCNDLCGDYFFMSTGLETEYTNRPMTVQEKRCDIERIVFFQERFQSDTVIPLKHISKINKQGIHLRGKLYFDPKKYIDPENIDLDNLVSSLTLGHLK